MFKWETIFLQVDHSSLSTNHPWVSSMKDSFIFTKNRITDGTGTGSVQFKLVIPVTHVKKCNQ